MRKELPALLVLAVSLSACSYSYSSSRSWGSKPGSSAGAPSGTGKPAKHAADTTPAPAPTPAPQAQAEPAPAPATPEPAAADPGRAGRTDTAPAAGTATLDTSKIQDDTAARSAKPSGGPTSISAGAKTSDPPKPSNKLAAPK